MIFRISRTGDAQIMPTALAADWLRKTGGIQNKSVLPKPCEQETVIVQHRRFRIPDGTQTTVCFNGSRKPSFHYRLQTIRHVI